jgi:hypothetical protein
MNTVHWLCNIRYVPKLFQMSKMYFKAELYGKMTIKIYSNLKSRHNTNISFKVANDFIVPKYIYINTFPSFFYIRYV